MIRDLLLATGAAATFGVAACVATLHTGEATPLPDFSQWPAGPERKERFFGFLRPLIEAENARVAAQRQRLLTLSANGYRLNRADRAWLRGLAQEYDLEAGAQDRDALLSELLLRVDTVPVSLGLAQAATESGWGTSRFAAEGNALFGQRCFEPGCGLVPESRPEGAVFEVRVFPSPAAAVASYVRNLNTHADYQTLRRLRARLRSRGDQVTGFMLASALTSYSEQGNAYIDAIRELIHFNALGPVGGDG